MGTWDSRKDNTISTSARFLSNAVNLTITEKLAVEIFRVIDTTAPEVDALVKRLEAEPNVDLTPCDSVLLGKTLLQVCH